MSAFKWKERFFSPRDLAAGLCSDEKFLVRFVKHGIEFGLRPGLSGLPRGRRSSGNQLSGACFSPARSYHSCPTLTPLLE